MANFFERLFSEEARLLKKYEKNVGNPWSAGDL